MIKRTDIAAQLEYAVRSGYLNSAKQYTPLRSAFTRETPSDGAAEDYADMGTTPWPTGNNGATGDAGVDGRTGAETVNQITGGGQITVLGGQEKAMRVVNLDWEIAIAIEHNAIDDNRTGSLIDWANGAGAAFEKHKDYLAFNALNAGAGTTYGNAYDGLTFFNANHVDPNAEYQTVQSNTNTVALSLDNYETVKVAGSNLLDDRGQPAGLNHNLLIHAPALARTAAQIVTNQEAYDTANREINPYAGRTQGIEAPGGWLDSTAWFIVDSSMPAKPINLQMRKAPTLSIVDDEKAPNGGIRYFKWHARYAAFYGDYRLCLQGNT